ncbi:MAG: hypothetical protein WKF70_02510 [Chitinophagaceae bacterium]
MQQSWHFCIKQQYDKKCAGGTLPVLDLVPVRSGSSVAATFKNSFSATHNVEQLGYRGFWMSEPHNMAGVASSATAVLIGYIAALWKDGEKMAVQQMLWYSFIGSQTTVRTELQSFMDSTGVDELVVSNIYEPEARLTSYELLAQAAILLKEAIPEMV